MTKKKKSKKFKRPTLILEGVDCGGKSTLGKHIQELWNCRYIHVLQAPEGVDTLVHFIKEINGIRQPTIIDRLHWSEEVYAKVLRGDSLLDDRDFGVVDGYLLAHRGIFVLCKPPLETVLENIRKDEQDENHNVETAVKIYEEYSKMPRTVLPVLTYDYTVDDVSELIERIATSSKLYYGG